MCLVLIIDDDAESRAYVREVAPSDWQILEAKDGLSGLDLVRQYVDELRLVILDMNLPDMEGRSVRLQVHGIAPALPILPFTGYAHTEPVLDKLGCLPPVFKPARPQELAQALRAVFAQPSRSIITDPVVDWAAEQSSVIEQLVRRQRVALHVVVYATSAIKRAGLMSLLGTVAQPCEAIHLPALQMLLGRTQWTALVADATDYASLAALAQEYRVPLVLVAANHAQATAVSTADVACVLLENDPAIATQLTEVIKTLGVGETPMPSTPMLTRSTVHRGVVPPAIAQRFADTPLSGRELDVLWLDAQGLAPTQIAEMLKINRSTIKSHWKRIRQKLGRDPRSIQAWVRERLREVLIQGEQS